MNCQICQDKGFVKFLDDENIRRVGVCLCVEGQKYRSDRNAGKSTGFPLWNVWAARLGIPFDRIRPIETFADHDGCLGVNADGREVFLSEIPVLSQPELAAVAHAMQTRRTKL